MDRTRVLFLYFYGSSMSGGPRVLLRFLEELDRERFEPVLATQMEGPLAEQARQIGVEVVVLPLHALLGYRAGALLSDTPVAKLRALAGTATFNFHVAKLLRTCRADVMWTRNVRGVLLCGLGAAAMGVPVLWDIGLEPESRGLVAALHCSAFVLARAVTVEADSVRAQFPAWMRRLFEDKMWTIAPSIDAHRQRVLRAPRRDRPDGEFRAVCVGTLQPRKNQLALLEVAAQLRNQVADFRLLLLGGPSDPAYARGLKEAIVRRGLSDCVELAGWVDEVAPYLLDADVFVTASQREGIPQAIIEAQHAGLPIVATPAGGTAEAVVDGVTGFIVPHGDAPAMVEALRRLAHDARLRRTMSRAARQHAAAAFDARGWTRSVERLLTRINLDTRREVIGA